MILQEKSVLNIWKSKVWGVAVIVIFVALAIAALVFLWLFIQGNQAVIV